jgi:hypothetical protein
VIVQLVQRVTDHDVAPASMRSVASLRWVQGTLPQLIGKHIRITYRLPQGILSGHDHYNTGVLTMTGQHQALSDLHKHLCVLVAQALIDGECSEQGAASHLCVSTALVTDVVINYVRYVKQTDTTPAHYEHRT